MWTNLILKLRMQSMEAPNILKMNAQYACLGLGETPLLGVKSFFLCNGPKKALPLA